MKHPENIAELVKLPIDFMGLIFYSKSPRYVEHLDLSDFPDQIKKAGVFVDADIDFLGERIGDYKLDMIQLHGNESVEYCNLIKNKYRLPIIKAFNVSEAKDFNKTNSYTNCCDYFLFDTKTSKHGGSGQKFDWSILNEYKWDKPFFLSGGISENEARAIKEIDHPQLYAIDLNSRFETELGYKNIEALTAFIHKIKQQ